MIVPSHRSHEWRAVQLRHGREFVLDGGDPLERLEQFAVAGEVAVVDLDAALGQGSNEALTAQWCGARGVRVGGGVRSLEGGPPVARRGSEQDRPRTAASPTCAPSCPKNA